jgi:hypothetical protein
MVAVRIARQDVSISILGRCQWRMLMMVNRPCPKCGSDNIRFDLTATANGFAISAQCRDCAQEFVLDDREAIVKIWNEGYFGEVDDE